MKNHPAMIAFSPHSTKLFAQLFCHRFKHCCVLFPARRGEYILIQIGIDGVRLIQIGAREIKIMKSKGWAFVEIKDKKEKKTNYKTNLTILFSFFPFISLLTCVGFAKRALGIRAPFIWTPDALYKVLST
jgi:hypothetical protein